MKKMFSIFLFSIVSACGQVNLANTASEAELYPEDYVPNPVVLPYKETVACPSGWGASDELKLCTQGNLALGPFTEKMLEQCEKSYTQDICSQDVWPLEIATALRGTDTCMLGATLSDSGDCVEGSFQYGPFRKEFVERCQRDGEQVDCESMRWSAPALALDGKNDDLEAYYSVFDNYLKVWDDVARWFAPINDGQITRNGCVAFLSTAMRKIGLGIPIQGSINGKGISINTEGFEAFVRDRLGWVKIQNASDLRAGDTVISEDRFPGHPDHVYMFHGWQDKVHSVGWVIDNQVTHNNRRGTYIHRRNIVGDQLEIKKSPYARHYRAPANF